MGRERIILGRYGERKAIEFLRKRGYRILTANFRTPFGEIDAVARHAGSIVFLEIKTRLSSSLGPPFLSVTKEKQRHMVKNAYFYLKIRGLTNSCWRIDVVSVKLNYDYKVENIELIESAVEEQY